MFPSDFPKLPLNREFNFSIDLVLGEKPQSKVSYHMASIEIYELNTQL